MMYWKTARWSSYLLFALLVLVLPLHVVPATRIPQKMKNRDPRQNVFENYVRPKTLLDNLNSIDKKLDDQHNYLIAKDREGQVYQPHSDLRNKRAARRHGGGGFNRRHHNHNRTTTTTTTTTTTKAPSG